MLNSSNHSTEVCRTITANQSGIGNWYWIINYFNWSQIMNQDTEKMCHAHYKSVNVLMLVPLEVVNVYQVRHWWWRSHVAIYATSVYSVPVRSHADWPAWCLPVYSVWHARRQMTTRLTLSTHWRQSTETMQQPPASAHPAAPECHDRLSPARNVTQGAILSEVWFPWTCAENI